MVAFLLRRIARSLLTVLLCLSGVFFVLRLAGDPATIMLPIETPPDVVARYREIWGLDRPVPEQYARYFIQALHGNFGTSFADDTPAKDVVLEALPRTALLGGCALLLAMVLGMSFGTVAALRHNTPVDRVTMGWAVLGYSLPVFFLGILLIFLFALKLRVLPAAGSGTPAHLVMPVLTLALPLAGRLARFARAATLDVMGRPFILATRAKGVPTLGLVVQHILPNAAVPLLMFLGIEIGVLLGGTAVVETIFAWPGLGRLLVESVASRDLPVVQACIITVTLIMVAANLLTDVLHVMLDPRLGGFAGHTARVAR